MAACAEDITLATCNVEYFDKHFLAHHLTTQPIARGNMVKALIVDDNSGRFLARTATSRSTRPNSKT